MEESKTSKFDFSKISIIIQSFKKKSAVESSSKRNKGLDEGLIITKLKPYSSKLPVFTHNKTISWNYDNCVNFQRITMMNTRHCHEEHKTLPNRNKKIILYCEEESRTTCLHCFNLGYSFLKISCFWVIWWCWKSCALSWLPYIVSLVINVHAWKRTVTPKLVFQLYSRSINCIFKDIF